MTQYNPFDFSGPNGAPRRKTKRRSSSTPPHIRKAAASLLKSKKAVETFLQDISYANALAVYDHSLASQANQSAIKAVATLLHSIGNDDTRRYSRTFSLLADNLAGKDDPREHNVKGATAFVVEYLASLPGQARRVKHLAKDTARVLTERGFPFSGKNAAGESERGEPRPKKDTLVLARGKTIELWRRNYRREKYTATYKNGAPDQAAAAFKAFEKKKPFKTTGTPREKMQAAIAWWYETLEENDY